MFARFKAWLARQEDIAWAKHTNRGKFTCPRCGAVDFVFVTNPVFATSSRSESRTKAMVKCTGGDGACLMRYIMVSKDYGKTWDPFEAGG